MSRVAEVVRLFFEKVLTTKNFGQCLKNVQILSAADGRCKAQFTVAEENINVVGSLHGGFTSTVIDCVSSYALLSKDSSDIPKATVSVDLHVTFLKAAFPGETVTVDAKTIHAGRSLAFLAVELTKNDGKDVIARGQHTKYFLKA
ncbi:acyl-coenzyme A thioesterase 13-like [Odontomachus brunneus]|uniref:acyl-coenzyme A thioesterase 13-like n=1 Tax=Odontomachus brunneus TaxID=486640 RepID=UPI0013F258B9|nr:acyl-coenzyme A thioesterase 13-like [Odontomachus brunneus]XP_032671273.1 acyl-coenzyme A thioesterase 13-like [Odontomachus brunneus]XP_032671274.1 acyl-coenzyme A thioesterase 13-like [Odontomachus brunneus]